MASNSRSLSPEQVEKAKFETKRRGYDPAAVDVHLQNAAETVLNLEDEVAALSKKVDALTKEVVDAKEAATVASQDPMLLDEDAIADRIGQDAARVLAEARAAAADRLVEAEKEAEQILVRAEEAYAARSKEADDEADRIRSRAHKDAEDQADAAKAAAAELVTSTEADLAVVRSEVSSDLESADVEANRIVREAELARRQILGDLLRRRGAAKRQIEQLRAGRERLLASHETVRRALDEITEELSISMSEARAAAKTAGHSVSDGTIEELEAEIETARLTGLLDTGPVPVVRSPALPNSSSANRPVDEPTPDSHAEAEAETKDAAPMAAEPEKSQKDKIEAADIELGESEAATESETSADSSPAEATPETDADSTSGQDGLAEVVELDQARSEVDTKSHPAKGREANNGRLNSTTTTSDTESSATNNQPKAEDVPVTPTKLVAAPDPEILDEDSVGDLFASLRSENDAPEPVVKKSTAKKKGSDSSTKKTVNQPAAIAAKKSGSTKKSAKKAVPVLDSTALGRRLKRVLADEQSRAMSTLKNGEILPDLDGLLFVESEHRTSYWNEVLDQLDDPLLAGPVASDAIDDLVRTIRRRVGDALVSANGDSEAAVASLRSIYREIKTQQIGETADAVSHSMLATS